MNRKLRHGLCAALFTLLLGAVPPAHSAQSDAAPGVAAGAQPRNFLWRISKGRTTMYLAGSIHTLNPDTYPLPDVMESAFQNSYALVEEVNLTLVDPVNAQEQARQLGTYPPGESLRTELSAAMYQEVASRAQDLGMDMQRLDRLRPWLGSITVLDMQMQQAAFNPSYGLDHHFADEAQISGKRVIGLETTREQLEMLARLPARVQQDMLLQSLQQAGNFLVDVHALIRTWENGDAAGMQRIMQHDFKNYPLAYRRLIVDRNRAWFPRLERLARSGHVYFVVVGAMHLIGPEGLLARFEKAGYKVKQL